MSFGPFQKVGRLAMLFVAAGVIQAAAQESIIFSKPADGTGNSALPIQSDSDRPSSASDYSAPRQPSSAPPSLPPSSVRYQTINPSVLDALNKRKNWTISTPEQILGIPTPESILGLPDKVDNGNNLSMEEKFFLRNQKAHMAAASGNDSSFGASPKNSNGTPDANDNNNASPFARTLFSQPDDTSLSTADGSRQSDLFSNAKAVGRSVRGEKKKNSAWSSVFAQPSPVAKQTEAQLASMRNFQEMLQPVTPPDKDNPAFNTRISLKSESSSDSATSTSFQQPLSFFNGFNNNNSGFTPAGSFADLNKNIARPNTAKPLPTLTTPVDTKPETRPEWQAQLPPWLQDGPQARNLTQRF